MKNQFSEDVQKLILELEYRNFSPRTVDSYRDTMQVLEKRLSKKLSNITIDEFKKYLQHLIVVRKCSTSYVNQHISAFKIFSQDILKRDWENIAIKRPRRTLKLPVVLSTNEVEQLLSVSKNTKHRAMLTLMYSAGLRVQELIEMKPTDIDSQRMQVHICQGKGRKDRYSILSPKCLEILRVYFRVCRPKTYLFEPNGSPNKMMSSRTLQHIVKRNANLAGIKKDITCHTLRHSFATHLLENGTNIKFIQQLLGHTSLRTTSVYLHLTNSDPASIKSPLEEMNI